MHRQAKSNMPFQLFFKVGGINRRISVKPYWKTNLQEISEECSGTVVEW